MFGQPFFRNLGGDHAGPAGSGAFDPAPFGPAVTDYYLTNPIARASAVMAECSRLYTHGAQLQAAE